MGVTPTPDPGPFVAGAQCNDCTNVIPLFAPGATPLTTVLTRHGGPGDPTSWTLTQADPCNWAFIDAAFIVQWFLVQAFPHGTAVNILWWGGAFFIPSFAFFSTGLCITHASNQLGVGAIGTWAELTW